MPRRAKTTKSYLEVGAELVHKFEKSFSKGKYLSFATILEKIFNLLMLKERELYLKQNPTEQKNGFYSRTLSTHFGKLNLKIPRIHIGNSFRPALLPPPHWKRFNKDYEEFILACLVNS